MGASGMAIMVARSLIARQASGEKRSRITDAAERAATVSDGNDPDRSRRVSAARAMASAVVPTVSLDTAFHACNSEPRAAMTGAVVSSVSAARFITVRTRRSVASARSM